VRELLALSALVACVAGCGGGTSTGTEGIDLVGATTASGQPRFVTFAEKEQYRVAYFACGVNSLKNLARQLDTNADPRSVAEAFAEGTTEHQAAFEGCLDVLLKKPAQVEGSP